MSEEASWGEEVGTRGSQLARGEFRIVIAENHGDVADSSGKSGFIGTSPTIHVEVDNLDECFDVVADPSSVVVSPELTHWGVRWFVITDPDGNLIAVNAAAKNG